MLDATGLSLTVNGGLPSTVFTTEAIAPQERLDYWRALHGHFTGVEPHCGNPVPFSAQTETWRFGPFTLVEARGSGLRFRRTRAHCSRDALDHWVIRLGVDTPWVARLGEGERTVGAGIPAVMRLSEPSETTLPPGDWRILVIPSHACPELSAGLARLGRGPIEGAVAGVLADVLAGMPRRLRASGDHDTAALAAAMHALLGSCIAAQTRAGGLITTRDAAVLLRERVVRVMRENIGSARLDVGMICHLAGLSRSALYRLFDDEGGVAHVVRDLRLRLVSADLSDPARAHEPISVIAERRGFHNASAFSRAFREAFGTSPSEARAAALTGVPLTAHGAVCVGLADPLGLRA